MLAMEGRVQGVLKVYYSTYLQTGENAAKGGGEVQQILNFAKIIRKLPNFLL